MTAPTRPDAAALRALAEAAELRTARRSALDTYFARATGRTDSGLAEFIQRLRERHEVVVRDGHYAGCVCGHVMCSKDQLLAWCDELIASYEAKVQEFAAETRRASELRDRLVTLEAENRRLREAVTDFADHGLRADLNPTMNCADVGTLYTGFSAYLRRLDSHVREAANVALRPVGSDARDEQP